MRVKYEVMLNEFQRVLEKYGFNGQDAHEAAEISRTTLAGVYSPRPQPLLAGDGLLKERRNRSQRARRVHHELWRDGALGRPPGLRPLKRQACHGRGPCELAKQIWHRPGGAGQQQPLDARRHLRLAGGRRAACIGICWSNTCPNMPAWGGEGPPHREQSLSHGDAAKSDGEHVVIDCALSQFSYGKLGAVPSKRDEAARARRL